MSLQLCPDIIRNGPSIRHLLSRHAPDDPAPTEQVLDLQSVAIFNEQAVRSHFNRQ